MSLSPTKPLASFSATLRASRSSSLFANYAGCAQLEKVRKCGVYHSVSEEPVFYENAIPARLKNSSEALFALLQFFLGTHSLCRCPWRSPTSPRVHRHGHGRDEPSTRPGIPSRLFLVNSFSRRSTKPSRRSCSGIICATFFVLLRHYVPATLVQLTSAAAVADHFRETRGYTRQICLPASALRSRRAYFSKSSRVLVVRTSDRPAFLCSGPRTMIPTLFSGKQSPRDASKNEFTLRKP